MDNASVTLAAAIQVAGLVQFAVAHANRFAARLYDYRSATAQLPSFVRDVFWVQNVFTSLTVVAFGALSLVYTNELSSGTGLGRGFSAFLALFWGLRLLVQLLYYDRAVRRTHRGLDIAALCAFVYLTVVFALAAL